jgi:DNA repair protein RadD
VIELRDYQSELVTAIRQSYRSGKKAPLVVLPTGGGKTTIFSYVAKSASDKEKTVWIIAHRQELVKQISMTLARFNCMHGIIAPEKIIRSIKILQFKANHLVHVHASAPVQVCSVQTLVKRMDKMPRKPDIIICDEAHHLTVGNTWGKVSEANPQALLLPVTATPIRSDAKGLGVGAGGFADDIIIGATMRELIDAGYLCDYRVFSPPMQADLSDVKKRAGDFAIDQIAEKMDKPKITGDAVDHYLKLSAGKRAIVFCCTVAHAQHVCEEFKTAGISSESLDGETEDRDAVLGRFERGETLVLTSCEIVSEGFDLPAIETAILLRPTASTGLYLQQVGRALRPFDGKEYATILDHVGNCARHGFPDDDRSWSLEGMKKRPKNSDGNTAGIRTCPTCYFIHRPAPFCPQCKHEYTTKERAEMEIQEGELVEITREQRELMKKRAHVTRKKEEWQCETEDELYELGVRRGYKFARPWSAKIWALREAKKPV